MQSYMSESKRKQLIRTLTALDNDGFTDEQWEEDFAGQEPVELPTEVDSLDQILKATSGKTIKPIEKWL